LARALLVGIAALLGAAGCATPAPNPNQPPHEGMGWHGGAKGMKGSCPLEVAGTTVQATDVDGGVALDFQTTGDVAEVRRRVVHMAEMHTKMADGSMTSGDMMQDGGTMGGGMMHGGMMHGGMMATTPADVRMEELPQGARLVFTPRTPTDLDALRAQTREHASSHAHGGSCPMLSMHGGKHAEAAPPTAR
jgi:hypothetical protein